MIITVGALVPLKGIDRLIDAMRLLLNENIKLYVIGEGPERSALEAQIAKHNLTDRVFLIGARPQQKLAEWYSAADLFCLASSREGCPNVVIEAMACGTPVVAADVGGVRELVVGPAYGRVISSVTAGSLAREINAALEIDCNRDRLATQVGARSWAEVAKEVMDYWTSSVEAFPPPSSLTATHT